MRRFDIAMLYHFLGETNARKMASEPILEPANSGGERFIKAMAHLRCISKGPA